MIVDIALYNAV